MFLRNQISKELMRFVLVGMSNTIISTGIIYLIYNFLGYGYWVSTGAGYLIGGIWSYIMNKYFTFKYKEEKMSVVIKFIINLVICYFISYSVAKPLCKYFLKKMLKIDSVKIIEEVAVLVGMIIYTIINFCGQKFFCFKKKCFSEE